MFVTEQDFLTGKYRIPQSNDVDITDFINEKEEELLTMLLGSVTYTDFINALFVDPTADPLVPIAENLIPQKWKDLRDGKAYKFNVDDEEELIYVGVRKFLIPFIAAEWWEQAASHLSALGESEVLIENSKPISPAIRIMEYWNSFISLTGNWLDINNTLYGFMIVNYLVDYPDWTFEYLGTKNDFDL